MAYQGAEDRYRQPKNFRRIVIISGDNTRTYTFSPLVLFGGLALFALASIAFFGATSYLVLRDDLIDLVHARNANMQIAYEDRIARLRSEIDKISSHQILDQVTMDDKIDRLLAAQRDLGDRQKAVSSLIDKASRLGLLDGEPAPHDKSAMADPLTTGSISAYAGDASASAIDRQFDALRANGSRAALAGTAPIADRAGRPDLAAIGSNLVAMDQAQAKAVAAIAEAAEKRADRAVALIDDLGIRVTLPASPSDSTEDVGGPYIPLQGYMALGQAMDAARSAFERLDGIRTAVGRLPLGEPLPGAEMTSPFGSRRDPFLGSLAFHPGIDFRSPTGTDVHPTAPGVVVSAGWVGGYGNMVEVDHGGGLSTRYGHLSRIVATVGQKVDGTSVIGEVGSTGRSTGPHLHYETRVRGTAINPILYIDTGEKLASLLGGASVVR